MKVSKAKVAKKSKVTPKTKPVYKRRKPHNFDEEEVMTILDSVLKRYIARGADISYRMMLIRKGLMPPMMTYWKKKSSDVNEMMDILKDIQLERINQSLLDGSGNTSGIIWYTKCWLGWVDEAVRVKIKSEETLAGSLETFSIGYEDDTSK